MLFLDYDLPKRLIAQQPAARRDDARLLVVRRNSRTLEHHRIRDLPAILRAGDLLVLNDTKVRPARLIGTRLATGGKWEALFLHELGDAWECLAKTRGYPQPGERFRTQTGFELELVGRTDDKHWLLKPLSAEPLDELLSKHGTMPLPPYIRGGLAEATDGDRYQTVYANVPGSVAAPTAGLHFTPELLDSLQQHGIGKTSVTLHVGLGTFAGLSDDDPAKHQMHEEWCEVTAAAVEAINGTTGRVIAVGTTAARTLESAAADGMLKPFAGSTKLMIHPPYEFRVLDGLLTNFHLPRTTLLLLVQSLTGSELLRDAYETAIREEYRFYSYGDAMLIL